VDAASPSWRAWIASKPFAVWVVFGGLFYFGVALLASLGPVLSLGLADPVVASTLVFAAILLLAAFLSFKAKRSTFLLAAVVSVLLLLLFGIFLVPVLLNPADPSFWLAVSGIPVLLLVLVFSILCARSAKEGVPTKPYLSSVRSTGGLMTIAVVGFVVGGLVVGNIAATSIARVLQGSQEPPDIRIVPGASAVGFPSPYQPQTFDVSVGGTVVWYNGDTAIHTITSDGSGQFDSGNVLPGNTFRHTFTAAGTFPYHCNPHPWMTGTVVVT
jgi:plastocyanin